MLEFLPQQIKDALAHLNLQKVYELRLRVNKPTRVNFDGKYAYLGHYGLTEHAQKAIVCDEKDVEDCIFRAGKYSVYSVEEQIKRGFITAANGERIGLSGEYVFDRGQPLAVRNISSLCIRIPHEIYGCGEEIYARCLAKQEKNLLIMSAPGYGKTTILRDLSRILSKNTLKNILICDERGEISVGEIGNTVDVIRFADKKTAFDCGIRAMRPDIIITDELCGDDVFAVKRAVEAGLKVLASAHFSCIEKAIAVFSPLFDRYVLLDHRKIGQVATIYDNNGEML